MSRTGRPFIDLTGKRFGKLTAIEPTEQRKQGNVVWECKCECGNVTYVSVTNLKRGHTRSCGCLYETQKNPIKQANPRLYNIWLSMRNRCNNKNYTEFYLYGGRGIKVCGEWLHDFNSFAKWSLNNGYSDSLSIDRIKVNGNYDPTNCRWATVLEQANNKRNSRFITVNGITHTLSEWSRIIKVDRRTLQSCLIRHGEKAMSKKFIDSLMPIPRTLEDEGQALK